MTGLTNVRYLTGFTGSNGQVLVTGDAGVFFTDGRYTEQSRHEVPDLERVTYASALGGTCWPAAARLGLGRLGFEAHQVTVARTNGWPPPSRTSSSSACDEEVERIRWVKDDEELELLRSAPRRPIRPSRTSLETLAVGVSERQVALRLEALLRRDGADGLSFDPIVAFGENAAEPHHEPGHRTLEEGDVIKMDFGALSGGYHADMTRTIAFGEPASELKKIHDVVRQAQQAGIDAVARGRQRGRGRRCRPTGRRGAGYGHAFTHGLGHGVGLDIHEGPRLGREFADHTCPRGPSSPSSRASTCRGSGSAHRGHGRGDHRRVPRARHRVARADRTVAGRTDDDDIGS